MKKIISTDQAPAAIGTYSQAVQVENTLYLSGQIPLDPQSMTLVGTTIEAQIEQVFSNLQAVLKAAAADLNDIVKLNIYLVDLAHFPVVNEIMAKYFQEPYPARAAIGIRELPKGALVEMDAVAVVAS